MSSVLRSLDLNLQNDSGTDMERILHPISGLRSRIEYGDMLAGNLLLLLAPTYQKKGSDELKCRLYSVISS
jgi:hypothetical protein